ncbi:leucine-rich repeat domain-containing protein [Bifidobacterium tibiigranuli]|jgi:internalin A|uniref:leucine-rich repeat domain-containing protein n=1 Tax=Bifidobacterium tibiigranuli TaxID=2172043 RepID=UPI0026ED25C6|nr:leucine-rich repeat domain-containing protein [Bifidobacterium tibiigranuli]MCI1649850.1 leucine-rich repeat domain-containing protein [Bifidobacterium tibiigranuli]MCI1674543.1 leucine-rich repeat domain-containing protein [Bifidobacterium tibiigranuli]MCI1713253.1 leucine-rich repeat domain-containing protein [Bifidobacterium tibiigranuli]MCI1834751.1 leucine-rich repeat domain-containing protein [Bifidobacterium tibiigranuli]MCI2184696.1 leucine-rich repeat domain-containing protein [Bif
MERSKPYKGARLGRVALGIALPVAMALGAGAVAPAATAATSMCTPDVSTIAQCFPDPGLAKTVAQAANHDVGQPLTRHDISSITDLDNSGGGTGNYVDNLQGIENLTNLTTLDIGLPPNGESGIYYNRVGDVSSLANLTKLTKLDLSGDQVSDVAPLSKLANLTNLDLSGDQVSDVAPLANLTKLTKLDLSGDQVSNIAPLSKLANLTNLDLGYNQVSDVAPLSNLINLTNLDLSGDQVSNIAPLSKLANLTNLDLSGIQVSDVAPLSNLTNLTELYLGYNQVSNIAPLSKLINLTTLVLSGDQVSDVGPLSNLTNLTGLVLDGSRVSDVGPLAKLTKLTTLGLNNYSGIDGNQVSDVAPLSNLTNLTELRLDGNQISNIAPLSKLTKLTDLYLKNNQISDISPLARLINLTTLNLGGNQISDVSSLSKLNLTTDPNINTAADNTAWTLGSQSVSLPAVAASSLSVPTARSVDGSFIKPDTMTPSTGSYDAKTGRVSWKGLSGSGSVSLHASTTVTIGTADYLSFDVTITQPYTPPTAPAVKYAVSFDAQGGSAVASQSVVKGGKATKPANPSRSGYTFNGWTSDKTGSKPYDFSTAVSANLTLYAQWKAVPPAKLATVLSAVGSSNVTVNSASVSATLKDSAGKPVVGAAVTFTTADGKTSASAKTDASGVAKASLTGLKASMKYSVGAKYAGDAKHSASALGLPISFTTKAAPKPTPVYTVSFDANGGKFANGSASQQVSARQGAKYALAAAPSRSGYTFAGWFTAKTGGSKVTGTLTATSSRTLYAQWVAAKPAPKPSLGTPVAVYRVYNTNSGLHHYTTSLAEKNALVKLGWKSEGASFNAAKQGSASGLKPVYREYNPHNGNHNWTLNPTEHKQLVKLGWKDEGVAWYANPSGPVTVYRLYNPHSGEHVYTTSAKEYAAVGKAGWHQEGTAWKGL